MSENRKVKKAEYDVVVIGGGMAGICAALASARHGARTALVHDRHVLGGNASSEIRMHICGASENLAKPELEESGILHEIMLDNKSRNDYFNYSIWDMVLFTAVKSQPHLTVYLSTAMEDCRMEGNEIREIDAYQLTTETHWQIRGNIFIDCTGNATLGYYAGAEYRTGSEGRAEFNEPDAPEQANNDRMGNTLLFKAVDRGHSVNFKRPKIARHFTEEELKYRTHSAVHEAKTKGDVDKAYLRMTSYSTSSVDYGYWWIELPGKTEDIIDEYEEIRDELVSCIYGVWDHLKNGGDHGAENYDLEWVGMLPGVRESRRLVGDYILNENDDIVALIKPQFEAGKDKVGKKGVVREASVHEEVIKKIVDLSTQLEFVPRELTYSPVKGPEGNIEYLILLDLDKQHQSNIDDNLIKDIVQKAHAQLDK